MKKRERILFLLIQLSFACLFTSCRQDYCSWPPSLNDHGDNRQVKTKNVIVVIMDGLRYSEGWGDSTKKNIPFLAQNMAELGVVNSRFYNNGETYTSAGHANITTGIYQTLDNAGNELPAHPSVFQYWLRTSRESSLKAWIITSKDKLAVLGNTSNSEWNNKYLPSVNAGNNGLGIGSGYRADSLTLITTLEILETHHPRLVLINFREPDYTAHSGNWSEYLKAIKATDKRVFQLWQYLQSDTFYKNTTALFVTSDHGRHSDGIADGFASHGDDCEGCRHLCFFAYGPNIKKGYNSSIPRHQPDLTATIAYLLDVKMEGDQKGEIMNELFAKVRMQ